MRNKLEEKWERRKPRTLSHGGRYLPDPAEAIGHADVPAFLERELPEIFQSLGNRGQQGTLMDMREFVSYAPRMVSDGQISVLYSGCQYEAEGFRDYVRQHLDRIDEFFCNSVQWLSRNGYDEVRLRILSGDFVLFEFDELRSYHAPSLVKRAWAIYRLLCEREGADWRDYRPDPETWHLDEKVRRQRYADVVHSLA